MSEIKDFYKNKSVLLSGATGMIGKLILAKFMRLGNVKEMVIFVRAKKGLSMEQRIDDLFKGFLFEKMEMYDPKFRSKLKLIFADFEMDNLGISNEDREYIKKNVEIIIHGAATIRFDEILKKSITINVGATKFMLELAKETKKLKSFVHISTAFSQSYQRNLKECFYSTPIDPELLLKMMKTVKDDALNALTPQIMYPWPNSYVFTKALAEDLVRQYKNDLPIAIIRPSIGKFHRKIKIHSINQFSTVQATIKDPVSGYLESLFGMMSLMIGVGTGIVRVIRLKREEISYNIDLIPADIVVNSTLIVAKETSTLKRGDCKIYNNVFSNVQKITGSEFTTDLN